MYPVAILSSAYSIGRGEVPSQKPSRASQPCMVPWTAFPGIDLFLRLDYRSAPHSGPGYPPFHLLRDYAVRAVVLRVSGRSLLLWFTPDKHQLSLRANIAFPLFRPAI